MAAFTQLTSKGFLLQEAIRPFSMADLNLGAFRRPKGVYIHVPFCMHKCHYCDFFSIVDNQDRFEAFAKRLGNEIQAAGKHFERPLRTIFVGGGTPTLLPAELWRSLLNQLHQWLPMEPDLEFTVEANPETVTAELVDVLVSGGVNRVSLGAQSFDPRHLKTLERWHDPDSVSIAVDNLRNGGIPSLNIDLIFAIPGQSKADWESDIDIALGLGPDHLSCYGLTYESNTPMTRRLKRGEFTAIEEDLEAEMYQAARTRLALAGFEHYEISAWARPSHRCRHNLLYWMNEDWWAFGPSASGHLNGVRWKNSPRLSDYLASRDFPMIENVERLDADGRIGETLMMGLRLIEGMPSRFVDDLLEQGSQGMIRRKAIERHVRDGLLMYANNRLRLTERGVLLADSVLVDLI